MGFNERRGLFKKLTFSKVEGGNRAFTVILLLLMLVSDRDWLLPLSVDLLVKCSAIHAIGDRTGSGTRYPVGQF